MRKRKPKPNDQGLLFPLPLASPELPVVEFAKSEHPVWTENKAKLIEQYLYFFVLVTNHGTYIDGFAGPQRPDNPEMWSAKLVLESKPQRLRNFFLFDIKPSQVEALSKLRKAQSPVKGRVVRIFHGDFNQRICQLLNRNHFSHSEATFCLLDQRTFECNWRTLELLAKYKGQGKFKIELFYFLAVRWLRRALCAVQKPHVLKNWWGRDDWSNLKNLQPAQIKDEFVNRFKTELGYKWAFPWPIYKQAGSELIVYYMIHATDHPEAPKLMARAYNNALSPPREKQLCFLGMSEPNSVDAV